MDNLKEQNEIIKSAQYRKGLSIAFFNATNASIELLKNLSLTQDELQKQIIYWRDWFLEEHKNYYATTISNGGTNYNSKETIEKLKTAKTIEELKSLWIGLSEDERRDGEIIKQVNLLKKSYEKV